MSQDDLPEPARCGREKLTWPEWFGCLSALLALLGGCLFLRWWL